MIPRFITILSLFLFLAIPLQTARASSDKSFTTTRLNKGGSVAIILGNKFGFDIAGLIIPFFTKAEEIATPNFVPSADFKQATEMYQIPQNMWDLGKIIRWDQGANPIYHFAKYGAILFTDADHSNHPPASDCIISEDIEKSSEVADAPVAFEGSQVLNATFGLRGIDANESGVIDFNKAPTGLEGMDAGEDCKRHDPGIDLTKLENGLRALSRFGGPGTLIEGTEMTTIMKIIEWFNRKTGEMETREEPETEPTKNRVILTRKQKNDHYNILCNDYWCPGDEIGKGSEGADKMGGWTNFLFPAHQQKKVPHASVQGFDVTIAGGFPAGYLPNSNDGFNQSQVGLQKAGCYATPDTTNTTQGNIQLTAYYGKEDDNVQIKPECQPIIAQCPIDIVLDKNPAIPDNSCKLNAAGYPKDTSLLTPLEQSAFPNGLPSALTKVLDYVGGLYSVPPSLILATMLEEGSFSHFPTWQWTDESVRTYSECTQPDPMPSCNDSSFQSGTGAKGALGLFQTQIDKVDVKSTDPYNNPYWKILDDPAFKEVLANRPDKTFSACNFFDAALYAAWDLYTSHSHLFVPGVPSSCTLDSTTYPISQSVNLPASCSDWDAARVGLARYQYGGYAYDPAEQGAFCDGIARVENTFTKY